MPSRAFHAKVRLTPGDDPMATATRQMTEIAMTLKLSQEASDRLARRAADAGKDVAAVASDLIEQAVVDTPPLVSARQLAALESFAAGMSAWTSRNLPPGHVVDDSRQTNYEGRGE